MMTFVYGSKVRYLSAGYLFCVTRIMNLITREIICQFPGLKAGFPIRIDLMQIRFRHFFYLRIRIWIQVSSVSFNNLIGNFFRVF
jgi:hypothetical protein